MQDKKASGKHYSFWTLFSSRNHAKFFSVRYYYKTFLKDILAFAPQKSTTGFTLIELIITIGILSVLSIGIISILNPAAQLQKANDARRKADLSQIQKSLEVYYQDNGRYPANYSSADFRIKGLDGNPVNWGASWQPYMDVLPKDPKSSKNYVYFAPSDGQSYFIYASLDRGTDASACSGGCSSLATNGISATACGGTCNFGLSSPNVSP